MNEAYYQEGHWYQ